jgi:hypothetical protein
MRVFESGETHVFRVLEGGAPGAPDVLRRVVVVAGRLLEENELPGSFAVGTGPGEILLTIGTAEQAYFYDGILFAALDVLNDPNRNPTLVRLSLEEG